MTSPLYQIQLSFIAVEDRLLFSINTRDNAEYQLWFTRRYIKLLWESLQHLLESKPEQTRLPPEYQRAIFSFQHEQALNQADFKTQYRNEQMETPLGPSPILASKISIKRKENGAQILCMHPEEGQGIELELNATITHSLCQMLSECVSKAEWDLELQLALDDPSLNITQLN